MLVPDGVYVDYHIVVDSPGYLNFVSQHGNNMSFEILVNEENLGAPASRNIGLNRCYGDYVLFLDDDTTPERTLLVEYYNKIIVQPNTLGFVGITQFPPPNNPFTSGILESDILTFFGISKTHREVKWGTTSNLLIRRDAIGDIRFSITFPKAGGGEDIDFCLKILKKTEGTFITVPSAIVHHGWWNNGKRSYKRFFRWAFGDSLLPLMHKDLMYRNYPNLIESIFIGIPVLLILSILIEFSYIGFFIFLFICFLSEIFWESYRSMKLRNVAKLREVFESAIVRATNDMGRLIGNLSKGNFQGLCTRFDYFTTGESIPFEKEIASKKFLSYIAASVIALLISILI